MPTKGEDGVVSAQEKKEGAGAARERWLAALYAATPADRAAAEQGVHDVYRATNREPPRHLIWLDSPAECCGAALLLSVRRDSIMRQIFESLEKNRQAREQLQLVRAKAAQAPGGAGWDTIAEDAGGPLFQMHAGGAFCTRYTLGRCRPRDG